jgi:hypothetical protein
VTGNLPDRLRSAGVLADTGGIARRTAELASRDQPVILWQRMLAPDTDPWVMRYSDDAVIAGDKRIDIRTGDATPRRFPSLDGEYYGSRVCRGVLICSQRTAAGLVYVAGADPRSGQVQWRHEPMPQNEYDASPLGHLVARYHHDPDVLCVHGLPLGGQRIQLIDWRTGRSAWTVPWPEGARPSAGHVPEYFYDQDGEFRQLRGGQDAGAPRTARAGGRVRVAAAMSRRDKLWSHTHGLAGVDEADGTIVWRIRRISNRPAETGFWLGPPQYLGGTDRYLVLVTAVGTRHTRILADGCSCPGGGPPDPGEPNKCASCGGIFRPWVMVAVHDRLSGRRLWGHRWPDREAPHNHLGQIADVDIRGGVVLTREGYFLRARRVEDGQLLWSAVPARHYKRFVWPGHYPASQWAWLARFAYGEGAHRPPLAGDLFVQASTGRTLTIDWVIDHTSDDLVLTHDDGMLTCLALPGSPLLRPPGSAAAQQDRVRAGAAAVSNVSSGDFDVE